MFNIFILFKYIPQKGVALLAAVKHSGLINSVLVGSKAILSQKSGAVPLESLKRGYDSKK